MRKTLLFLSGLLLLLAGCSNEELGMDTSEGVSAQSSKVRWYGAKLHDGIQTKGVADGFKRWNQDAGIRIKFLNNPNDARLTIEKIKLIASEWEKYAGIKFIFVDPDVKADVRIAFNWNENDWITWSYTGTDAKFVKNQSQPTAVFGGLEYQDEKGLKGDVLRLFGQILGLEYEQRHQEWSKNGYWKSEMRLQNYWQSQFEGHDMAWDEIREYVFDPLTNENTMQLLATVKIDELSVMAWPYYNLQQTTKLLANYELSQGDKEFVGQLYPQLALPTIQKAWVDAGYFEWTDQTKTALLITELGKQQEYLPDVSDGEQLTSALALFDGSRLKKAPKFSTTNITDFCAMFANCNLLTDIPKYDTSKGTF